VLEKKKYIYEQKITLYRKTRTVYLPEGEQSEDTFIGFDRMHECDRQTDGQMDTA